MRVAVVAHGLAPHRLGGVEVYTAELARELANRMDIEILVVEHSHARPSGSECRGRVSGVPYRWLFTARRPEEDKNFFLPEIQPAIERFLDDFKPDLVHIQHLYGAGLGVINALTARRIPLVWSFHDYWPICHQFNLLRPTGERCAGPTLDDCAACGSRSISDSEKLADRFFAGLRKEQIETSAMKAAGLLVGAEHIRRRLAQESEVWSRIELEPYPAMLAGSPRRSAAGRASGSAIRVGFVGTVTPHKGLGVLKAGLAGVPNVEVIIAGDGAVAYLRALKDGFPNAEIVGPVARSCLPELFHRIDLLVVPSIWEEGYGIVCLDAFAMGVPIVASDIGGLRDSVQEGRGGLRFPPGDSKRLREIIVELAADGNRYRRLVAEIPEAMSMSEHAKHIEERYRKALA